MQVCITIGCCHHVCRQFVEDSSSTAEVLKQTTLAPFTLQSTPQLSPADEEQADASDNVVIVPSILEWSSRPVFSPSIKFLTILNTDNTSWIKVSTPVSTDEQFFVQAIDRTAIAPGESLKVPVVFLPRKPGPAAGRIILETSAGKVASLLRGEGHPSPHHLPELVGIEAVEGRPQQHRIRFHNPYEEVVEIDEVQVWPEDAHNKALCLSDDTEERITSCFADSFAKAALSKARNQKYASNRATISLTQLDQWKIQPQETAELVEVETTVTGTWSGLVYIKFSRNNAEEVAVIPLELNIGSEKDAIYVSTKVDADQRRSCTQSSRVVAKGNISFTYCMFLITTCLQDLAHKLLKRSDIRKGSLAVTPKLPRELVARCRSFRLHERIALPVSICALVLVLGIFSSLLLQELSPKRDIRKQIMQCLKTWKHTIASRFKATRGKTLNLKFEESRHLKPLRTSTSHRELHELPRSQSSLSPRSQCSSSGPPSPHSCSESEMKVAPIERYFSSSRFSESPRKPKPRNLEKKKVAAHEDVQAAWDGFKISPKEDVQAPWDGFKISPKEHKPTNAAEDHESTLGALSTQPHPEDAPFSHPSPVVTPENVRTEVSGYRNLTRQDGSSCVSPVGHNRNQDTSSKQQPEAFYDIWGDHFADIRGAFSTPGSPSGFLDSSQSLFSQSLPRSTGLRYSPEQNEVNEFQLQEWFNIGDDILRSSEDRINVPDHSQLPRSEDLFGVEDFLPGIETCTSLLGTSYFDWNNDHLYRVPVS